MAEQRNADKIILKGGAGETVGRSVEQPDGVVYQKGLKVGDQKNPKLGYGAPRFGEWDGLDSNTSSYASIFNKVREERRPDFGRDTNRLDYFSVTALNLHGDDDDLTRITDYGGGGRLGGGHEVVVLEQDRGGGGDRFREIQSEDVANDGGEVVVKPLKQEKDSGIGGAGIGLGWWEKWCYCCHCGK